MVIFLLSLSGVAAQCVHQSEVFFAVIYTEKKILEARRKNDMVNKPAPVIVLILDIFSGKLRSLCLITSFRSNFVLAVFVITP